ncbi:hypothetical protein [Pseudanabaena cinerea]|nr:hypothetical protein [Pseudanabaena cinerea]
MCDRAKRTNISLSQRDLLRHQIYKIEWETGTVISAIVRMFI